VVSYGLSIVTIALTIRPHFAIEYISNTQIHREWNWGVGHVGPKFREEVVYRCKPTFNTIWERHDLGETWGCRMQKKSYQYLLPFEYSAQT